MHGLVKKETACAGGGSGGATVRRAAGKSTARGRRVAVLAFCAQAFCVGTAETQNAPRGW